MKKDQFSVFESKVDMPQVREWLSSLCVSELGRQSVDAMRVLTSVKAINHELTKVREMRWLLRQEQLPTTQGFHDLSGEVERLRIEGSYLTIAETVRLKQVLEAVRQTVSVVSQPRTDGQNAPVSTGQPPSQWATPVLYEYSHRVKHLPDLLQHINRIINDQLTVNDDASPQLFSIRQAIRQEMRSMSGRLQRILSSLQAETVLSSDATAVVRDGVLLLPVPAASRHKVDGVSHGESQGGNIVYIEPQEIVHANHRLRQLQGEEQDEIVRILKQLANVIRPHWQSILQSLDWLGLVDFVRAKALLAEQMEAIEPSVHDLPLINWHDAYHPLLRQKQREAGKTCVPLTIRITEDKFMLVISGPNAGGKSVCLKTVGLLQCMVQCGLSIPVGNGSEVGMFHKMMVDIGDDQSIDDELSTYSSHLRHLKRMLTEGDAHTLLLIDELGGGTEPTAGGAIAEVVLAELLNRQCRAIVTTHYQNLKLFASTHPGVENGAMLYDDHRMLPLYQLVQGQAGSSFALDIARRVGFPQEMIARVQESLGQQYVKQERFLHDVYRDRRYWNDKRKTIAQLEKQLQERIEKFTLKRQRLIDERDNILHQARLQAQQLVDESNRLIENTIRQIRESNADKEATREIRRQLHEQQQTILQSPSAPKPTDTSQKKEGKSRRSKPSARKETLQVGMAVKIKGMNGTGIIESLDENVAVVATDNLRMRIDRHRLEAQFEPTRQSSPSRRTKIYADEGSLITQAYSPTLDIRGQRAEEALHEVERFVDETVVRGMKSVRILHGKGDGILSSIVRKYLKDRKEVQTFYDEHVDYGGAGITIVEMK